jgi:hypothetical protein
MACGKDKNKYPEDKKGLQNLQPFFYGVVEWWSNGVVE